MTVWIKTKFATVYCWLLMWYVINIRHASPGDFDRAAKALGYITAYGRDGEFLVRTYTLGSAVIKIKIRFLGLPPHSRTLPNGRTDK